MQSDVSIVPLPRGVRPPLRVFVNGIEQREGEDFRLEGRRLVFNRTLAQEGRLGFWRWASIVFGVAGTYRKHETVDVQYQVNGRPRVAANLKPEPRSATGSGNE
jgi:hypothetical protein